MSGACPRCGYEVRRAYPSIWADRLPLCAAVFGVPTMFSIVSVTLAYPWFFVPLLVVAAAWWIDRQNRQRAAIAARADYEYRQQMASLWIRLRQIPRFSLVAATGPSPTGGPPGRSRNL